MISRTSFQFLLLVSKPFDCCFIFHLRPNCFLTDPPYVQQLLGRKCFGFERLEAPSEPLTAQWQQLAVVTNHRLSSPSFHAISIDPNSLSVRSQASSLDSWNNAFNFREDIHRESNTLVSEYPDVHPYARQTSAFHSSFWAGLFLIPPGRSQRAARNSHRNYRGKTK